METKVMDKELKEKSINLLKSISESTEENVILAFKNEIKELGDLMLNETMSGFVELSFELSERICGCSFLFSKKEVLEKLNKRAKELFAVIKENSEDFLIFNCIVSLFTFKTFVEFNEETERERV